MLTSSRTHGSNVLLIDGLGQLCNIDGTEGRLYRGPKIQYGAYSILGLEFCEVSLTERICVTNERIAACY